jgi:glycosyltransferase involved in cell wall biosynthesis
MQKINLTSPINQLGFGVVGLNAVLALQQLGYEVALWPIGEPVCPAEHQAEIDSALVASQDYCPLAPSVRISQPFDLAHHIGRGTHAAITYFERDLLTTAEIHCLQNQDVVIASSAWMSTLLAKQIHGPKIAVASPGVDRRIFSPYGVPSPVSAHESDYWSSMSAIHYPPRKPSVSEPTTFLVVGKWEFRKGHDLLPTLFQRAFVPTDNFKLVLMTVNPFLTQQQHSAWCQSFAKLGSKVEIHHTRLPDQQALAQAMFDADCGVFLSRAEGWNLDAAEMLTMGKHIIITNYSAHSEFANRDNAWLVEIDELEPAYDGFWFDGFGNWAKMGEQQQLQAVSHLRAVHQLKQAGRLGINLAGQKSMLRFTWQAFASQIVEAIGL